MVISIFQQIISYLLFEGIYHVWSGTDDSIVPIFCIFNIYDRHNRMCQISGEIDICCICFDRNCVCGVICKHFRFIFQKFFRCG